jgi:undecaprenyl-phosphate 4-deoxy-4-formamido-L-arabinose transferase
MVPLPSRKHVSVVVPVFNGTRTLAELVARLLSVLATVSASTEIILVNDGSRDESWAQIRKLVSDHRGVIGLDLMRNYGQQNALLMGVEAATGDIIVTIDDDLDYPPEEIPRLLAALGPAHDLVYGVSPGSSGGPLRRLVAVAARWVVVQLGPNHIFASSFRAFDASLRQGFPHSHTPYLSLDVLLTQARTRPVAVTLPPHPRVQRTRYGWAALASLFATAVTGISVRPLQFASWVGAVLMTIGALGLVGALAIDASSVAWLVLSGMAFLSGLQCCLIGILGAYVGRIHALSLGHPAPVVRERIGEGRASMVKSG